MKNVLRLRNGGSGLQYQSSFSALKLSVPDIHSREQQKYRAGYLEYGDQKHPCQLGAEIHTRVEQIDNHYYAENHQKRREKRQPGDEPAVKEYIHRKLQQNQQYYNGNCCHFQYPNISFSISHLNGEGKTHSFIYYAAVPAMSYIIAANTRNSNTFPKKY